MRNFRLVGAALLATAALTLVGSGALDDVRPLSTLAAAPCVAAEPGSDAMPTHSAGEMSQDGHEAAGHAEAGHGVPGEDAHGGNHSGGHENPVVPVLALLLIVILAAKIGGAVMEKIGQPGVLGELVFGVLLGNLVLVGFTGVEQLFNTNVFGILPAERMIEILGEIGVVLLLFEVGLESNIKEMMSLGASSLLVATLGVVAPFFLGWGVGAWLIPDAGVYVHVFLGATLCATSVGITARVLKDLNKINLRESKIVLGAAVIDDVMGLVVLAVVSGFIVAAGQSGPGNGLSTLAMAWIVGKALLFLVGAVVVGQWAAPRIFAVASKLRGQHLLLTTSLIILFALSYLANKIGLATIVGAFAAGLILDEVHYKVLADREEHSLEELLQPLAGFLVPIFFVYMGYKVNLAYFADQRILGLAAGLTIAAIIGKQICSLGVIEKGLDKLSVGIGMVPRGEVGLIFASIGMGLTFMGQPIISEATYGAVVIMVIVTTLITPPALKWSLNRPRGYEGASDDEMARIAAAKREKRKEYYRSRAQDEERGDRRRRGDRDRGRGRGRGGGRGRPARARSEAPAEGGGGSRRQSEGRRQEEAPRAESSQQERGGKEGGGRGRRRRRPRRRRGGSGGGAKGGGGRGTEQQPAKSEGKSEKDELSYSDST